MFEYNLEGLREGIDELIEDQLNDNSGHGTWLDSGNMRPLYDFQQFVNDQAPNQSDGSKQVEIAGYHDLLKKVLELLEENKAD